MKPACRRCRRFLHRRQRAKTLRFDGKDWIELAAKVFQSDDRGELNQLFFGKMAFEPIEETICHSLACVGHALAQFQREFFPY